MALCGHCAWGPASSGGLPPPQTHGASTEAPMQVDIKFTLVPPTISLVQILCAGGTLVVAPPAGSGWWHGMWQASPNPCYLTSMPAKGLPMGPWGLCAIVR